MLKIIQNERQPWSITLTSEKNNGLPFDLTGNTEINVCFKAGAIVVNLDKTSGRVVVDDEKLGKISGFLSQSETDSFGAINNGSIEIQVDFGSGDVRKTQILAAFSVTEKLC